MLAEGASSSRQLAAVLYSSDGQCPDDVLAVLVRAGIRAELAPLDQLRQRAGDVPAPVFVCAPDGDAAHTGLAAVREQAPDAELIMLLPQIHEEHAARLIDLGADDCIALTATPSMVEARMRAACRRAARSTRRDAKRPPVVRMNEPHRTVEVMGRSVQLTPTEFSIFRYLAERPGEWVSSTRIISDVIGTHHTPRTALVRVHLHHIRRKLGESSHCLHAEHGRGYMFRL